MKAYKGFNKDLTCMGYRYEIGKTYECEDAEVCDHGFHACLRPADVFAYYVPVLSRYCEVDVDEDGLSRSNDDSKVAARRITIVREISLQELHEAQLEYARDHAEESKTGGDRSAVTGGDRSVAVSRGSVSVGHNGLGVCRGNGCRIRGGISAVLVIAEENTTDYNIATWKAFVVDGETIKADTWYKLIDGELVEDDQGGPK